MRWLGALWSLWLLERVEEVVCRDFRHSTQLELLQMMQQLIVYEGSAIRLKSHIQIAIRNPACILGIATQVKNMPRKETDESLHLSPSAGPLDEWKIIEKGLDSMNKEEVLETFVSAGILTKKGNATKHYRGVFKKQSAPKRASA